MSDFGRKFNPSFKKMDFGTSDYKISTENSFNGRYSGNSSSTMSGGSTFSPTMSNGVTSFNPSISHSVYGSHHQFGGGLGVSHQVNQNFEVSASYKKFGRDYEATAGFGFKF